ncbi:MAG TPA: DUF3501 family protein [Acidimicrobiales bacterium]|nr:DUF3501 family protein [Acidimicrobiales bacterium]
MLAPRAERMLSDEQIQTELDVYNPLIRDRGQLSATLLIELTDAAALREWLPRLVGLERSAELRLGELRNGGQPEVVRCIVEQQHLAQLTRQDVTASVHYIRFQLTWAQIEQFGSAPVELAVDLPAYQHATRLSADTRDQLLSDLHTG